jgi:hypothetical protein
LPANTGQGEEQYNEEDHVLVGSSGLTASFQARSQN